MRLVALLYKAPYRRGLLLGVHANTADKKCFYPKLEMNGLAAASADDLTDPRTPKKIEELIAHVASELFI